MQAQFTCSLCGAAFTKRRPSDRQQYCSADCYHDATRADRPENFWRNVIRAGGCWDWQGQIANNGYGRLGSGPHRRTAHNVAWEFANGEPIPDSLIVGHACDRRRCVRNDDFGVYVVRGIDYPRWGHLWLGTHVANMADMADKRRAASGERNGRRLHPESAPRGEAHRNSKLTAEDVLQIRIEYAAGGISLATLGSRYGVTPEAVFAVVKRRLWQHI